MNVLKKIDAAVGKVLDAACLLFFAGLFILLALKVFFRIVPVLSYFPSFSTGAFDEIIEWLFAWLIMTCSSLLCRSNEHFRVDILQMKLGRTRAGEILETVVYTVALVFYLLLFVYGLSLCRTAVQTTALLRIQVRWFYLCMPVNAAIMCVYTVRDIAKHAMGIARPAGAKEG